MEGVEVGMGSSGEHYFAPFHIVAECGAAAPRSLSEPVVRAAFGGTISPRVGMVVEPLEERGRWWAQVREYLVENDDALGDEELMAEGQEELDRWSELVRWFRGRREFHGAGFVMMGPARWPTVGWSCCNFPYLAAGITEAGSLVGIWGNYVDR
jgi:hypothetical protein